MDEPKKGLETVKLNVREFLAKEDARRADAMETVMAEEPEPGKAHDGRFGEKFDDELSISGIVYVVIGIAAVTALGFVSSLLVYNWAAADYGEPSPTAAAPAVRPAGPLLQSSPEAELREMRREVHERLHGYGWSDEAAGTVYIPIEKAIDLVAEGGLPPAAPAAEEEAAP